MKFVKSLAAAALVVAASCGGSGSGYGTITGTNGGSQSGTPVQTNAVSVNNDFFSPPAVQVAVGQTVTWTWVSGATAHNVTFSDGTASGDKTSGGSYSRTFNTAGTFSYHCTIHPGMTGSVTVQ
jgi:plastocyanin